MNTEQPHNPLHGVKLEQLVTDLVDAFGWKVLAQQVNVNCFRDNPSIKSSLKFLRKTPWARDKVESLYVYALVRGKPLRPQSEYQAKAQSSLCATAKSSSQSQASAKADAKNSHTWNNLS